MWRRALLLIPAGLVLLVLPGVAGAQEAPTVDDPAVSLIARTIAATRTADSMHLSVTGSGSIPGGASGALTLGDLSIEADLDLAHQAGAAQARIPSFGMEDLEIRVLDGTAYVRDTVRTSEPSWWSTDASFVTDVLPMFIPGTGRLVRDELDQAGVETLIRRKLKRADASAALTGEQVCAAGTCATVHIEVPLSVDSSGLTGLLLGGDPGTSAAPVTSGTPVEPILAADVLVDTATTRLDSIVLTQQTAQGDITITLAVDAYDTPVTVEAPPADQVSDLSFD